MSTKSAVEELVKNLKEDPDYRYTWKSNIAMAFKDEYNRSSKGKSIHEIANSAADCFLELLCNANNPDDFIKGQP